MCQESEQVDTGAIPNFQKETYQVHVQAEIQRLALLFPLLLEQSLL